MEKNKRNKIIGLSIGILIVLIIVVSSTYAYWQITRTQETPNDIVAACLNLDLADASAAIDLDSAWPISDEEGKNLTGYTFTVTNNCNEEINYIVGLNRVEESNYLQDSSIKVRLDEQSSHVYEELSDVEYADSDNTEYTSRVSKQVSVETISAKGTNEHIIRVWVNESAPVTEQSKIFKGQVFITGGQGIEVPELNGCFTITNNGTILGYDESCGLDVKVPAEINGIKVKEIAAYSFPKFEVVVLYAFLDEDNYENYIYYKDLTHKNEINSLICGEIECDFEKMGYILIDSVKEYNEINWNQYIKIESEIINYDEETQDIIWPVSNIKSLDLSEAIYLETIEPATLYGGFESETPVNESCTLVENTSRGNYYECKSNLKSVIFPQNGVLKTIGGSSFTNGQLTEVVIPYTVETIGSYAFENNQITSLVFEDTEENPSRLKILGSDVFSKNKIEGVLTIPSAVEEIGGSVFSNNNITKVIIPSSIKKITSGPGYEVFDDNPNLTEIIIKKDGSEPLTHPNNWPSGVTITYDPNYTE